VPNFRRRRIGLTHSLSAIMPGLVRSVPGIHVLRAASKAVDGRDKPGHDEKKSPTPP